MSIAVASQWIANLLVSATFPLLLGNDSLNAAWNHGFPFWLYGSFGILAAFIVHALRARDAGRGQRLAGGVVAARGSPRAGS